LTAFTVLHGEDCYFVCFRHFLDVALNDHRCAIIFAQNSEVFELQGSRDVLAGEVSSADALADKARHKDLRDRVHTVEAVRADVASIRVEISEPNPHTAEVAEEDLASSPLVSLSLHLLSAQIEVRPLS
jgi:hypothetical protein